MDMVQESRTILKLHAREKIFCQQLTNNLCVIDAVSPVSVTNTANKSLKSVIQFSQERLFGFDILNMALFTSQITLTFTNIICGV